MILLGTPRINEEVLIELASALYTDSDPITTAKTHKWVKYNYIDRNGDGYESQQNVYADDRLQALADLFTRNEIVQAAHRIRPVRRRGVPTFNRIYNLISGLDGYKQCGEIKELKNLRCVFLMNLKEENL